VAGVGTSLDDVALLDTLVTVVDAGAIMPVLGSLERLKDRGEEVCLPAATHHAYQSAPLSPLHRQIPWPHRQVAVSAVRLVPG